MNYYIIKIIYLQLCIIRTAMYNNCIISTTHFHPFSTFFPLKRTIDRTSLTFKSCCILFDALIKPIMLYAAQIWFPSLSICKTTLVKKNDWLSTQNNYKNNLDAIKNHAAELYEKVHLKFLKWALGVHPKASNVGTWGESGRHPLTYECLKLSVNYFNRLENLNDNSLLSLAFKEQQQRNLPWYSSLTKIITSNGNRTNATNIHSTPPPRPSAFLIHNGFARDPICVNQIESEHTTLTSSKTIPKTINNLKSSFDRCWGNIKEESPKLSFYHQAKSEFKKESYLDEIKNFNDRAALTQFRISAHDLKIETGRYSNQTRDQRNCSWCQLTMNVAKIENEQHFLLECDLYNTIRRTFVVLNSKDANTRNTAIQPRPPLTLDSFQPVKNDPMRNIRLGKTIAKMFKTREKFMESVEKSNDSTNNHITVNLNT